MLAFSPWISTISWPEQEENWMGEETWLNPIHVDTDIFRSFVELPSPSPPPPPPPPQPPDVKVKNVDLTYSQTGDNIYTVKKLSHNANERDRRKKLNSLYSTLRSLLPATEQTRKLSVPATVSRVLKYIPDLQKQVENLIQRRQEMLDRISKQKNPTFPTQNKGSVDLPFSTVSATPIDERELLIQICTFDTNRSLLSNLVLNLEEDGLRLLNASAFPVSRDRVCYSLHLQMKGIKRVNCAALRERLASLREMNDKGVDFVRGGC